MNISYHFLESVSDDSILETCSKLYSENYGVWSRKSNRAGERVKLSKTKMAEWFEHGNASICYAADDKDIIGYAVYFSVQEDDFGTVTWITQLVVHSDYRHRGIAENILFSIWGFSDHKAWGIVTANPYAIRALEKITRRRATPRRIMSSIEKIREIAVNNVNFIDSDTEFAVTENQSKINTKFYVDHEDIQQKIINVTQNGAEWLLGQIEDGWEWCAFTFQDQEQIHLSEKEISDFVRTSDALVKEAYSRMILDKTGQKWMRHEIDEINYLKSKIDFSAIKFSYDLGCGTGRHSFVLAKDGIEVIGIDYIKSNIDTAEKLKAESALKTVSFVTADCRNYNNGKKADLTLCLYDVAGTFATKSENLEIIKAAYNLTARGGYAVFSVMNYELTAAKAKYKFKFSENPNRILELNPSNIMEKSGNIFSPDYYLVDEETHVVYRKEQFSGSNKMPRELIVRDMRFTKDEIVSMCQAVGFSIIESKFVNASDWKNDYSATDDKAKEILVICRK